jgi:hypothetical protein
MESPFIRHFSHHRVTVENIDAATKQNAEITRLLLCVFQNVYVHDDDVEGPRANIESVMLQVREKTHLKIINLKLSTHTTKDDYVFLFGAQRFRQMEAASEALSRSMQTEKRESQLASVKTKLLCMDTTSMNSMLLAAPGLCAAPPKAYSNILDAMIATKTHTRANVFDIAVFEIPAKDVKPHKGAIYARFARVCHDYNIIDTSHVQNKLYVQIEMKQQSDENTEYLFGPFPSFQAVGVAQQK